MKIKTIDINAKEWFDKVNGNSYFSAKITLNYGTEEAQTYDLPFQYGYSDHYIDMANQYLIKEGIIKGERHDNGCYSPLWRYCKDNKIILRTSKQANCKKREL
jgi:hypothetical protein